MIVGIGTDVVEIQRLREIVERHDGFLKRTFTPRELRHSQHKTNPYPHLAARFAAKEAVMKALGTGWSLGIRWTDIAVENNGAGKPTVQLSGVAERLAGKLAVSTVHLSLAHTRHYASAQVVMEG